MPNWCGTNINILCSDEVMLKAFYKKLVKWSSKNYCPNGFGKEWLGNIVGNSGLDTCSDTKDFSINCRGSLLGLDYHSGNIAIMTDTAWSPMLEMWVRLIDLHCPSAHLIFTAEEPGNEIFVTNDDDMLGRYYIDVWEERPELGIDYDSGDYDCSEKYTRDLCTSILTKAGIPYNSADDIDRLIDKVLDIDGIPLAIHPWESADIEDYL